jgi:hypothetical protein
MLSSTRGSGESTRLAGVSERCERERERAKALTKPVRPAGERERELKHAIALAKPATPAGVCVGGWVGGWVGAHTQEDTHTHTYMRGCSRR